jgi:GntR family transcriptional regulator
VAERLHIEAGTPVASLRRVRTADDRPAIYSIDRIPADLVDVDRDREAFEGSIYDLLASRGQPIVHGEAVLMPAAAEGPVAAALQVATGTLLQSIDQVDISSSGRRVLHSLEWHVPSVIELRVYRRGPA